MLVIIQKAIGFHDLSYVNIFCSREKGVEFYFHIAASFSTVVFYLGFFLNIFVCALSQLKSKILISNHNASLPIGSHLIEIIYG